MQTAPIVLPTPYAVSGTALPYGISLGRADRSTRAACADSEVLSTDAGHTVGAAGERGVWQIRIQVHLSRTASFPCQLC
eukprot:1600105-Rhodomonas_salina.1